MTKPVLPMDDKTAASWRERIEAGTKLVEKYVELWKQQQSAYVGQPLKVDPVDDTVIVNKDMPRVKQKVAQLFYQVPKVHLKPKAPQYIGAVQVHQAVVNHKLTHDIKAAKMVDEVLTDVVAVSGIGVSKIGYEVVTVDTELPLVDPETAALIEQGGGVVPTDKVPVPVYESYFWKRITPAKLLLPPEFTGTDFDEAPWIGFRYRKPYEQAKRDYGIDEAGATTKDERTVTDETAAQNERTQKEVECTEIWYKAHLYDRKEKHPLKQRRVVFIEGKDEPVIHEDSPYQRFDETGKFIKGMKKFPIRVLTLTTVPDESIPPSDTTICRPLVQELQTSRSQMIKQRKLSMPLRWFNTAAMDPDTAEKIQSGNIQDIIPLSTPGDVAIGEVARANYPRENFEFQRVIEADLMESWALGSNQMGADSPGEVSASEAKIIQGNSNVRLDYERTKVLRWFLDGAELLGDLIQLFADDQDYVEVVGQDHARALVAWNKDTIAGEFVYEAQTNSQLRLDVAQERLDARNAYQLLANEPFANRQKLVEKIAETHDMDPAQFIAQPPPKQPEPPNVSFRFSGEDLNPLSPSFPLVLELLAAGGFKLPPQAIMAAKQQAAMILATAAQPPAALPNLQNAPPPARPMQTEHGGPAKQAEPLSKHQLNGNGL